MKYLVILFYCFSFQYSFTQIIRNSGPISTSMAGINVNNIDTWSINNNIGQLVNMEHSAIGVNVFQPFLMTEFTSSNLVLGFRRSKKAFGFNYSNYGNEFLQINNAGFGYSMKLSNEFQSGIKLNYYHFNSGEYYNTKSVVTADLGLVAKLTNELNLGVNIKNPTLTNLADFENEKIQTEMQIALGYHISNQLSLHTALNKSIIYPTSLLAAVNYSPNDKINFRGGIGSNPNKAAFGIGVNLKLFEINFATQVHQVLGWSPDFSISYSFEK